MVPGRGQPNLARPGEAGHRDAPGHEHEGGVAGVPGGRPGRAGQPQSHGGDGAGGNVSAGQEGKAAHRPDTDGADDPECRADAQRGCQRQRRHYPARDGAGRGVDAAASTRKPQQHQRADQAERRPAEQAEAVGALACEGEREGAAVAGGDAECELAGVDTLGGWVRFLLAVWSMSLPSAASPPGSFSDRDENKPYRSQRLVPLPQGQKERR